MAPHNGSAIAAEHLVKSYSGGRRNLGRVRRAIGFVAQKPVSDANAQRGA